MVSQDDDSMGVVMGVVMGVIFGVIALVVSLIIGVTVYRKNKATKAVAAPTAMTGSPPAAGTATGAG